MMRSLFAGVSGLKVHQTRMDSIGNNIANINTVGFKSSRTTFADMLSQTQAGAAAPSQNVGGTNPKQIGLGVSVASIDLIFTDGSPQSTGKNTDLALSGNGLFVVKNGDSTFYTRNGSFSFDENGYYVLPGSGLKVQGWNAVNGSLNTNSQPTDIIVPTGKTMEAQATSEITFSGNLNAGEPVIVSIGEYTNPDYAKTVNSATNITLSDGSTVTVTEGTYRIGHSIPMSTVLQVIDSQGNAHNVPIQLEKTQANTWEASLSGLRYKDVAIYTDEEGVVHELEAGAEKEDGVTYTTVSKLIDSYSYISEEDGSYTQISFMDTNRSLTTSFSVNFTVSGQTNTLTELSARMQLVYNFDRFDTYYYDEDGNKVLGTPPAAGEGEEVQTYATVAYMQRDGSYTVEYTRNGESLTLTGTRAGIARPGDTAVMVTNGTYTTASNIHNSTLPVNGASPTNASVNFLSLTQYAGSNSAYPRADGNVAGTLVSISVDTSGVITGTYTNGMNQFEAQVAVAQFTNAAGLTKSGNSIYAESNNSGVANIKTAPDLGLTITPSALEMSNVDLANEFSEMIITQRGFQANSKIINVGDEMLETLVNMKR